MATVVINKRSTSVKLESDHLEPLRTGCCDLMAINLANHRILRPNDHFDFSEEDGGVYLNAYGRAAFFKKYEQTMRRKFLSPQIGHHVDLRQVIDFQVCQFLKLIDGDTSVSFFSLP